MPQGRPPTQLAGQLATQHGGGRPAGQPGLGKVPISRIALPTPVRAGRQAGHAVRCERACMYIYMYVLRAVDGYLFYIYMSAACIFSCNTYANRHVSAR